MRRLAATIALLPALALSACLSGDDPAGELREDRAGRSVTPRSAAAFNDSIGVATHPTYFGTVHDREGEIAQLVADAGIRHVRNGMAISDDDAWNERAWANMRAWPDHGLVSSWGVDRCTVTFEDGRETTVRDFLDKIAEIDGDLSVAIEATNEVNLYCSEDWAVRERQYVAELAGEIRRHPDPVIRSLPLIGPSFGRAGAAAELGDIRAWIDFGNTHPYTGCTSPSPEHVQRYGIDDYAPAGGSLPVIATEVGFHTAVATVEEDVQPPCDERSAGIYTLRTVLEHFKMGIPRTYLYEAVDLEADPEHDKASANFGILRNDLSAKPAYLYLKNLLATTRSAAEVEREPIRFAIAEGPADVRTLLLRRSDGAYVLALWRHVSVWDRDARRPRAVEPVEVAVRVPADRSAAIVEPHVGAEEKRLSLSDGRAVFEIAGDTVLLVLR